MKIERDNQPKMLTQKGLVYDLDTLKSKIGEAGINFIKKKSTINTKINVGKRFIVKQAHLYKIIKLPQKTLFILARFSPLLKHKKIGPSLAFKSGLPAGIQFDPLNLQPSIQLRSHQNAALDYLMDEV